MNTETNSIQKNSHIDSNKNLQDLVSPKHKDGEQKFSRNFTIKMKKTDESNKIGVNKIIKTEADEMQRKKEEEFSYFKVNDFPKKMHSKNKSQVSDDSKSDLKIFKAKTQIQSKNKILSSESKKGIDSKELNSEKLDCSLEDLLNFELSKPKKRSYSKKG